MTIVDIYCRIATDDPETRTKLEQQEATCRTYCETQGLAVGKVFHEVASGVRLDRESLNLMRRRYREGLTQGVVVMTADRLSRSHVHLIILVQEMEQYAVEFYVTHEWLGDTATDRLVRFCLDLLAEVEREKAQDEVLSE